MSSDQALEVAGGETEVPISSEPQDVSTDKDPKGDNNNGKQKDKVEEMEVDSSDPTPEGDGVSKTSDAEKTQEANDSTKTDSSNVAEADSTETTLNEASNHPDDGEVGGAGLGSADKVESGASNVVPVDGSQSPRGGRAGRGRSKGRGRGRWSPAAIVRHSPKAKRKKGRGRSLTQSDFVFPDGSEDSAPEIKKPGINVVDKPLLLKPFEAGWFREHVLRGSADEYEVGKKASDIYYFTPEPTRKKVRSMVEISDYLIQHNMTDLSSDCFSFARCTIYKAPFDISRYTFRSKGDSPKVGKPKKPVSTGSPLIVKFPVKKKDSSDMGIRVVEIPGLPRTLKIVSPQNVVSKSVAKKRTGGKIKRTSDVMSGPSAKKPSLMANYNPRLCGMECPGKQGVPPELHCRMCMCLFHADCVGYSGSGSDFACPECTRINGISGSKDQVNGSGLPPLRIGSVSRNPTLAKDGSNRQPPTLLRISPAPAPVPQINIVGSFNVCPPPTLTAVSSHVITLPPSVVGKIKLNAPLTLKTDGKDLIIPPSCMIATPEGMKVFLPPGVLNSAGVEPGLARAINIMPNPSNPQTMSVVSTLSGTSANPIKIPEVKILDKTKVAVMTRVYPGINPAACFVQKMNGGLICCRRIFQFLTVQDRLRAAQVCRTWKDIISQPLFWDKVRMRDSTVMDWDKAAQFLKDNKTKFLDMRGLQHPNNDKNRTWHQFTGVLDKLTQLQEIQFDQCPVQILQSVAEKMTGLRLLSSQFVMDAVLSESQMWSTNAKIDFDKFKGMSDLEELRMRGACGLALVNSLNGLSNLKNLKILSLATLKDVKDEEYKFLESLTLLEELELGDCDEMNEKGFKQLENLSKLKRLRLEGRPETVSSIVQLGQALQNLKNLTSLELIKFAMNEEFLQNLKNLKLKHLTLWPETGSRTSEINTAVYKMVHEMTSLESLEWAIIGDQIGEGSDNSEGHHQNESILILKDSGEQKRVANIREISEKLFNALPKAKIRVFRIGVPVLSD